MLTGVELRGATLSLWRDHPALGRTSIKISGREPVIVDLAGERVECRICNIHVALVNGQRVEQSSPWLKPFLGLMNAMVYAGGTSRD